MAVVPEHGATPSTPGAIEVLDGDDLLGIGAGSAILIADDDPANRIAYEAALAPLGRELVLVSSGVETLATLLDRDVALILLDVQMPEMTGLEAARMLRGRARNKGTPIIFITGMGWHSEVVREAYELGAFDFVIKPIEPEILRAKVRLYLQLQDRTRDVMQQRRELREQSRAHAADVAIARRLEKLQEATAGLAEAKTPADVASVAVRLGADAVSAATAVMWLLRPDGTVTVEGSHAAPQGYLARWPVLGPDAKHPVRRVLDRCTPLWIENAADYERDAPEILEAARAANSVVAFASLPLRRDDKAVGVLSFGFTADRTFSAEERRFLQSLVHTCEQALERAHLYVTEAEARRRAESESARKDELLAMLGHELRNPLASIVSALEIIKLRDNAVSHELSIVDRQTQHLAHLVHDLVDVSRLTQGKITLSRSAVQLAEAVQQSVDTVRASIDAHQHQLAVIVPDDLLVDADRDRLCQVLANLLSNAAKYTSDHGRIEVVARADGAVAEIEVRDNGIGIPAALLPDVFDIFVQGERTIARREGGLGVGLTIVRSLVELHGGTIAVRSDATGTTFTVRWPIASSATATTQLPPLPRPGVRRLTVLVVDDNEDAAELLAALTRVIGHDAFVAHDARSALQQVEAIQPDLALLDIGLPDVSGYELVAKLRALPNCASTVMVAVTGYSQPKDQARAKEAGFDRHFAKPIGLGDLTTLLQSVPGRTPHS